MKRFLIVSFGFLLAGAGCQTSQINGKSGDRYPAFSSKPMQQPPQEQAPVVVNDPVAPPVVVVQDPNPPIVINVPPADPTREFIQISAVNGQVVASHAAVINVHPGDIISLTSSVFLADNEGFTDEDESAENFVWTATGFATGQCDGNSSDCLLVSPFQATDYGVNFYVPNNMGPNQDIGILVSDPSKSDAGSDSIILHVKNPPPPPRIVIAPQDYPCTAFSDDCALNGQGNWVYIGGQRYFAPYITDNGWQPYSHGYWTWVDGDGWTWVSYDQWGWYTDHYGYWRHHGVYGWIWSPYANHQYFPHGVSWFYDGEHVGWYPYNDGYAAGYAWGAEHGFDDGYWDGHHDSDFYANYHPGFYHVNNQDFGQSDVYDHRSPYDVNDCFHASYNDHHNDQNYGRWPGATNINDSRTYVTNVVRVNIVVTNIHVTNITVVNKNNVTAVMRYPLPVNQVPSKYASIPQQNQRFAGKPIPVGALVTQQRIVPPTMNGRGIASPPVVKGATGTFAPIRPIARTVAQPNPEAGMYHVPPAVQKAPPRPPVVPPRQQQPVAPARPAQPPRQQQPPHQQDPAPVAKPDPVVKHQPAPPEQNQPEPKAPIVVKPQQPPHQQDPAPVAKPDPVLKHQPAPPEENQPAPKKLQNPVVVRPAPQAPKEEPPVVEKQAPKPPEEERPAPARPIKKDEE